MLLSTTSALIVAGTLAAQTAVPPRQTPQSEAKLIWGDIDRDGRQDLFAIDPLGEDLLLRNAGEGRFDDVTQALGLPALEHVRSGDFGDFDGDGWLDLALVGGSGKGRLLRNIEGRLFEEVSSSIGLEAPAQFESVRFEDFDRDGRLDLVLAGALGDVLFRGVEGRFERVELPRRLLSDLGLTTDTVVVGGTTFVTVEGTSGAGAVGPRRLSGQALPGAQMLNGTVSTGAAISATAAGSSGSSGGSGGPGGPGPVPGGTQPLVLDREIPSGFSILGPVDGPTPQGYMATGETVSTNGDMWFKPNLPAEPGPDNIPQNRLLAGHSVAMDALGEKLFVFGGRLDNGDSFQTSGFKFDAEALRGQNPSQQWATIAAMPQPARANMAAVTVDDVIYSIGGEDALTALNQVDAYDPLTDGWTTVAAMTLPAALSGAIAGAIGRRIYVYGGTDNMGNPQSALLVFDLDLPSQGWTQITGGGITPTPRANMVGTTFDGKLYVIGGFGGSGTGLLDVTEVYDPDLNRWERRSPRPTSFQWATLTVANGKLLVFGGENPFPIGDVHQYDPLTDVWSARESMITPRSKSVAGRLCKSSYVAAGEEEGPMPMPMPMPVPVNEEYLENQDDKAVYTKM